MLTATILGLTLPLVLPQTWPVSPLLGATPEHRRPTYLRSLVGGAAIQYPGPTMNPDVAGIDEFPIIVGPAELLADRLEFARITAAELMTYCNLGDNWDEEGAVAPSLEATGDALRMLEATPSAIGAPKAMAMATGEIALYWDFGDVYAEIGFDGSGKYYAYAKRPDAEPIHLDDMALVDEDGRGQFPTAVIEVLTWEPTKVAP
jgi:hypothetical protein